MSGFDEITRARPEKSLVVKGRKRAGRNNKGRITMRHQGGGNKRRFRIIDFRRNKDGVPAKVAQVEYDPTGARGSRCCTTRTARSVTSWPRMAWPRATG